MALLEVYDLAVHYGEINALKGVSLQVEQGDFITLIGANGAGENHLAEYIDRRGQKLRRRCVFS